MHEGARLPLVPQIVVGYLDTSVGADCLWLNHLALGAQLLAARRYEPRTIYSIVGVLNARFRRIAASERAPKRLRSMRGWGWNLTQWMQQYFRGELCDDTPSTRMDFWRCYQCVSRIEERWLAALPARVRRRYRPFVLPIANNSVLGPLVRRREVIHEQQQRRKDETDAVMPLYSQLRAEAHLRFNQLARLRQAYREVLLQCGEADAYPRDFSFEEKERRFCCRVWNEASFLAHLPADQSAQFRTPGPKRFLELQRIEDVRAGKKLNIDEQLWYAEAVRQVLAYGNKPTSLPTPTLEWLRSWGYARTSLYSPIGNLVYWSEKPFMRKAQQLTTGLLIPIDQLYYALSFGLLALDLITTTGARLNEVMQVSFAPDCLVRLEFPAPSGAADPRPRIRYVLRLLPKGERKDEQLHDYFIGDETKRLLVQTGRMLAEHYETGERGAIPAVPFDRIDRRAHRFGVKPYVFQLHGRQLSSLSVSVCLRLLVHGAVLRTQNGRAFSIRPHLLRHAFATHAVQVEKIPVDIVGRWLHQKSLGTTAYYSQPTDTMAADAADQFLARMAAHIDVESTVLRSPAELQRIYEDAVSRSGTLASVPGGACTSHGFCKVHFTCIGCPAKVPDPAKRNQVLQKVQWAQAQIEFYRREGLTAEIHALEQLLRAAAEELREMDQIEHYRRDELRSPEVETSYAAAFNGTPVV